ncbi:hypothetical protein U1Q18_035182 [Sarracenia purpurea var. burkii]
MGWRGLLRCSPEKMLGSLMEVEGELADGADGKGMPQECTGGCDVGLAGWRRQGVEDGGRCTGKRRWAATSLPASEVDMDKLLCYGFGRPLWFETEEGGEHGVGDVSFAQKGGWSFLLGADLGPRKMILNFIVIFIRFLVTF